MQYVFIHKRHQNKASGNGMEWNGMEWNGMEWNGMEWNGMEWNGMEASRESQKGYHPTPPEEPELLEEKMNQNQESIDQSNFCNLKVMSSFFVKGSPKAGLTSQADS